MGQPAPVRRTSTRPPRAPIAPGKQRIAPSSARPPPRARREVLSVSLSRPKQAAGKTGGAARRSPPSRAPKLSVAHRKICACLATGIPPWSAQRAGQDLPLFMIMRGVASPTHSPDYVGLFRESGMSRGFSFSVVVAAHSCGTPDVANSGDCRVGRGAHM